MGAALGVVDCVAWPVPVELALALPVPGALALPMAVVLEAAVPVELALELPVPVALALPVAVVLAAAGGSTLSKHTLALPPLSQKIKSFICYQPASKKTTKEQACLSYFFQ